MNRQALLSTLALMLASSPSYAQITLPGGGVGGQGMVGGQVMPARPMMYRGGFYGPGVAAARMSVQIEMEGGQRLSGEMDIRPIIIDGDLGTYSVPPDKIKMIRFLKPPPELEAEPGGPVGRAAVARGLPNQPAALRALRRVGGGPAGAAQTHGKVVTTTDKDIIGTIYIPADFTLDLDFGTLTLAPDKLRSITFAAADRHDKPAATAAAGERKPKADSRLAQSSDGESLPSYLRRGRFLIVVSPVGDRVTLFDIEAKTRRSLALSGSKDAPLEVLLVPVEQTIALMLKGAKITRIAVVNTESGLWHSQDLRTPINGEASPITAPGVVVYVLGRDAYAYGTQAQRWDVIKLDEGVHGMPSIEGGTATIEGNGHIYTFAGKSGKWAHINIRKILETVSAEEE